jgi:hypothetical protein
METLYYCFYKEQKLQHKMLAFIFYFYTVIADIKQ